MSETVKIALFCALALIVGLVLGGIIQKKMAQNKIKTDADAKAKADAAAAAALVKPVQTSTPGVTQGVTPATSMAVVK